MSTQQQEEQFFPVYLQTILVDSLRAFDIYIPIKGKMILYHAGGERFNADVKDNLLRNKIDILYLPKTDQDAYNRYIEENLAAILRNSALSDRREGRGCPHVDIERRTHTV